VLHGFVKVVQVFISQNIVIDDVPLSPGIVERVAIPFTREVKPLGNIAISQMRFLADRACTYFGVPKFVPFKVKIAFTSERVDNQATRTDQTKPIDCSVKTTTYRIILCKARPREITGVNWLESDMFVSVFTSKPVFFFKRRMISTHLLVHQPECKRFIAYKSLVMALSVRDALLKMAPVCERVGNVTHVPCVVLHVLEELDPLVRNRHGEAVVKADAPDVCRDTKKRHPRHIFGDGDDIGEEGMQDIVCL